MQHFHSCSIALAAVSRGIALADRLPMLLAKPSVSSSVRIIVSLSIVLVLKSPLHRSVVLELDSEGSGPLWLARYCSPVVNAVVCSTNARSCRKKEGGIRTEHGIPSPSVFNVKTRAPDTPPPNALLREDDEDVEHVDDEVVVDVMEPRWRLGVSSAAALLWRWNGRSSRATARETLPCGISPGATS